MLTLGSHCQRLHSYIKSFIISSCMFHDLQPMILLLACAEICKLRQPWVSITQRKKPFSTVHGYLIFASSFIVFFTDAVFSEGEESLARSNYFCSIFLWNLLAWVLWFFFFQHQNFSRLFYYNSCLLSFSEIKIISFFIMPIVTKLRVWVESLENLFVFWLFWPSRLYVMRAMKLLIIRQMELIMMCFVVLKFYLLSKYLKSKASPWLATAVAALA